MGLEQQAPMTYRRAFSRDGLILTPALGCTARDQHLQLLPNIPKLPKTQATCSGLSLHEPLGAAPRGSQLSTVGP